jgi:hypothetical protein
LGNHRRIELGYNQILIRDPSVKNMPSPIQPANIVQILRKIPPKWAIAIIGIVLVYWLTHPLINRTFGLNLPSIASLIEEKRPPAERPPRPEDSYDAPTTVAPTFEKSASTNSKEADNPNWKPAPQNQATSPPRTEDAQQKSGNSNPSAPTKNSTASKSTSKSKATADELAELARKAGVTGSSDQTYGFLKEIGKDRYRSPAGLVYGRGSEEGHRLKHIERHLTDQPTRPGPHGVFDGDMPQVLRWIDEAYGKAVKGDRMAKKYNEEGSAVYEYTFSKPIGFLGGSVGKRKNNPSIQSIRIVVRGQDIITAFPF